MTFQKMALTPEEMEKTAGGWYDNLKLVTVNGPSAGAVEEYKYTMYDDETRKPIAIFNDLNFAEDLDHLWNVGNKKNLHIGFYGYNFIAKKDIDTIKKALKYGGKIDLDKKPIIFLNEAQQEQMGPYGTRFATITK